MIEHADKKVSDYAYDTSTPPQQQRPEMRITHADKKNRGQPTMRL